MVVWFICCSKSYGSVKRDILVSLSSFWETRFILLFMWVGGNLVLFVIFKEILELAKMGKWVLYIIGERNYDCTSLGKHRCKMLLFKIAMTISIARQMFLPPLIIISLPLFKLLHAGHQALDQLWTLKDFPSGKMYY